MSTKKSLLLGCNVQKLTNAEQEILTLLTQDCLTPRQIIIRRGKSKQSVYKHIKNLKVKGYLKHGFNLVDFSLPTSQPKSTKSNLIRLHGQEFNVRILFKDERYRKLVEKSNFVMIDGNSVRLYGDSLEVYSGRSFFGEDASKATSRSFEYWNRFFIRLEHDFKIVILKSRSQNIRLVNSHYAEVGNEFARSCEDRGDKVKVFARDDGKLWFLIDNSFRLCEAECVHPRTSKVDMDRVKPFFNDLRDNNVLPLSKLSSLVSDTVKQVNEVSHGLKGVTEVLRLQYPKKGVVEEVVISKPDYVG